MVTADLVLELALVLMILIVFLGIPRTMVADNEGLAASHRRQTPHHKQRHPHVQSIYAQARVRRRVTH